MKILIVGGGIGGLVLASMLKKEHELLVIDKSPTWKEKGFSIGLWPNGSKHLEDIGLKEELKRYSKPVPGNRILDHQGKEVKRFSFDELAEKHGPLLQLRRTKLHEMLVQLNQDVKVRLGIEVRSINQSDEKATVTFSDDTKEEFDLVVGSDGLNSQVRRIISPKTKIKYTGWTGWIFYMPHIMDLPKDVINQWGNKKFFGLYPTGDDDNICGYFAMPSKEHQYEKPEERIAKLKEHFSDLGGDVKKVLDNLPSDANQIYHHDHNIVRPKKWYKGSVVLLGDALHTTSPLIGMGASMAIEDAFVLSELLRSNTVKEALRKYRKRREERVRWVLKQSLFVERLLRVGGILYRIKLFLIAKLYKKLFLGKLDKFLSAKI